MSAKNRDEHNRWRNKTVAFRMSPEESNELDMRVKLSGLTKQDYLINRALQRDIVVVGNPKVYVALKKKLEEVLIELKSSNDAQPSPELLETIKLINKTLYEIRVIRMNKQIKKTAWDSSAATDDKRSANKSINIITENKRFCN